MNMRKLYQMAVITLLWGLCTTTITASYYRFEDFPIGVFSADGTQIDADFKRLQRSGVNLVHSYGSSEDNQRKLLDCAQKYGMKVMFNLNRNLIGTEDGVEIMRKTIRTFKNHPALGFWYLYDEPAIKNGITPEKIRPFYTMIKQETPRIPVAMTLCWDESFDQYQDVLDIQMADMYPVRLQPFPEARLDAYSTFVEQTKALGKPVIGVPQLMTWKSFTHHLGIKDESQKNILRFPNLTELRYFYFSSLAQGVSGLIGYSYYRAIHAPEGTDWWEQVASKALNDVKAFTKLIMDPSNPLIFKHAKDAHRLASYWRGKDGSEYLMLVNCWPMAVNAPSCYLEDFLPGHYSLKPWNFTHKNKAWIKNHALKVEGTMGPWEVMIWKMEQID